MYYSETSARSQAERIQCKDNKSLLRTCVNQAISALRCLSKEVLKQSAQKHDYIRLKSEKKLPYVLSEEEVLLILRSVDNLKHRVMLYLAYSSGLREVRLYVFPEAHFLYGREKAGRIGIRC